MRKLWDFHGGVHPAEHKSESNASAIRFAGIPPQLILPLSQHIGAPAEPVVEVGDTVLKGQLIAAAKSPVSAPLHAPTSGQVSAIEDRLIAHPSGISARCLVLKPDGEDRWVEHNGVGDYRALNPAELLERIRNAGIAGLGGAGFPTQVKLKTGTTHAIDTLILNGTECEPYITADDRLMRERAEEVVGGAEILRHLVKPSGATLIGIEDNKPQAIEALRRAAEGSGIEVVVFPTKYPSGGERQLIEILTGREVPAGGLPSDIGVICQNVGTCAAIYRAVHRGEPLISRVTTVTGAACAEPGNFEVLIGTPIAYLLSQAGFNPGNCSRLIMGGPMMGFTLPGSDIGLIKTTNCILAPTDSELPLPPPAQACIRCGMCSEVCPASLLPQQLYWFARGQEYDKLESHNLMDCIECGACSYVCPSNIPLVQYYRASKGVMRERQQEKIKSDRAKQRFEAHKARIARQEAEKEARRKARKEAAKAKAAAGGTDPIQAAVERSKAKRQSAADPAQAAIERARTKRQQDNKLPPREKSEQAVASLQSRLEKAEAKLAANDDPEKTSALENAVNTLREKLATAEAELVERDSDGASVPAAGSDPAQAAIERAQSRRWATESAAPEEKAQQSVEALRKRLSKAEAKLADNDQPDKTAALENAVATLRDKLATAEAELTERATDIGESVPAASAGDPAQAAIERARTQRARRAALSQREKLEETVASLEKRLDRARAKLADAEREGSEHVEVLAQSVEKLESTLAKTRRELENQS